MSNPYMFEQLSRAKLQDMYRNVEQIHLANEVKDKNPSPFMQVREHITNFAHKLMAHENPEPVQKTDYAPRKLKTQTTHSV